MINWLKKAKNKVTGHQSGALKQCKQDKHIAPDTVTICQENGCVRQVCENCQIEAPNQKYYCMPCFTAKPTLLDQVAEEDGDDDEMAFDLSSSAADGKGFTKVGV